LGAAGLANLINYGRAMRYILWRHRCLPPQGCRCCHG